MAWQNAGQSNPSPQTSECFWERAHHGLWESQVVKRPPGCSEYLAEQLRRILSSRSKGPGEVILGSFLPSLGGRQESGLIILILQMRTVGSLVTKSLA